MPIIDYSVPRKISAYAGMVKSELDALLVAGDNKATTFTVPTVDAGKVQAEVAAQANAAGKTARFFVREFELDKPGATPLFVEGKSLPTNVKKDKDGNVTGNTKFIIGLTSKHKARRGQDKTTTEKSE